MIIHIILLKNKKKHYQSIALKGFVQTLFGHKHQLQIKEKGKM